MKRSESCSVVSNSLWRGILQARLLEWVTFPFSRGSSQPRDQTQLSALQADSLPTEHQGSLDVDKTVETIRVRQEGQVEWAPGPK